MTEGLIAHEDGRCRCWWPGTDPLYVAYHDTDWGVPEFDDRALFEKLILDGFQAGLSWITILRKRENFRSAFAGFDPAVIARFDARHVEALMLDAGIVRNRAKIEATISGARAFLAIQDRQGFSKFLWDFVDGRPVQNDRRTRSDIPAETDTSRAISKALRAEGFNFVGPTIVYAFMQAVGMVNDHLVGCFRHADCAALAERTPAGRGP
jgi:DNA-3-methyladenine glycosylase I